MSDYFEDGPSSIQQEFKSNSQNNVLCEQEYGLYDSEEERLGDVLIEDTDFGE